MTGMEAAGDRIAEVLVLGGPVVALILSLSVLTLAVILWKLWDHARAGIGRHQRVAVALEAWDTGDRRGALTELEASPSHLAPMLVEAMGVAETPHLQSRIEAEAAFKLDRLDRGIRLIDSVAQVAPLLGLFGTVLGMIDAFRTLQEAGTAVDPSLLAGGIWVALMTTAAGLALAMPASLVVVWFETRMAAERALAETALHRVFNPMRQRPRSDPSPAHAFAHAG